MMRIKNAGGERQGNGSEEGRKGAISNRMSLILFSAIILDLRPNVASFSETYVENEHCSLIGTG